MLIISQKFCEKKYLFLVYVIFEQNRFLRLFEVVASEGAKKKAAPV